MESLSDRLKSLGFKVASTLPQVKKEDKPGFDQVIGGSRLTNSMGDFYLVEHIYQYGYRHGKVVFSGAAASQQLKNAARISDETSGLENLVFLDTETTGISGGSGTFAFLVGVGRFVETGFLLQQFIISDPQEESAMLLHLDNWIKPDDILVTFNGKTFDIPLLRTRYVLNRLPSTLSENLHLDMLHISRRLWRKTLESCALKDLEREILTLQRSEDEVPGWMVPEIYFDYLRTGETKLLTNVIYHNEQDVVSLAALFLHVSELFEKSIELEGVPGPELLALARIYTDIHVLDVAESLYRKSISLQINGSDQSQANYNLGMLIKSKSGSQAAIMYWKTAAENGHFDACIELSMVYEHQVKDLVESRKWAEKALGLLDRNRVGSNSSVRKDLLHRLSRIQQKESNYVPTQDQG